MWDLKRNSKKEEELPLCSLCGIEQDTTEHVLKCRGGTDRKQRNIKNNTEEEWEGVVQIFWKSKRKREERREKVYKSLRCRFCCSMQMWTVEILALNWSAQSQNLCWRDLSSSDQREEPQELHKRERFLKTWNLKFVKTWKICKEFKTWNNVNWSYCKPGF